MAVGTFFTLFVIPSIYMLVARDHAKDRAREKPVSTVADASGNHVVSSQPIDQNPN
jgi:multidrug efflux pump